MKHESKRRQYFRCADLTTVDTPTKRGRPHWEPTAEQEAWMRANAARLSVRQIADHLHHTQKTVRKALRRLQIDYRCDQVKWSEEEDMLLRDLATRMSARETAAEMGRNLPSVKLHAFLLCITFRAWQQKSTHIDDELRDLVAEGKTVHQMVEATGKAENTIRGRLKHLGIVAAKPRVERAPCKLPVRKVSPQMREQIRQGHRQAPLSNYERVEYCKDCGSPVVDTPHHWYAHRVLIHGARRVA